MVGYSSLTNNLRLARDSRGIVIWFPRTDAFAAFPGRAAGGYVALTGAFRSGVIAFSGSHSSKCS
jgi:hypothetical protein